MTVRVDAENLALPGRLHSTSLSLRSGELTCLIGPNGSGKTSLLHALAGLGNPAGRVSIDGVDPHQIAAPQRMTLLSYLPASREVHWPVTARDLVAIGASGPDDLQRIPELLAELHLGAFAERRIDRMSTGERSRVLIARALVSRAKVVLLDEPAANLDPLWQLRLMALLREHRHDQCLLVAVHDLALARQFADRLIVMQDGRIVADADPQTIFAGNVMRDVFGIEERDGRWIAVA